MISFRMKCLEITTYANSVAAGSHLGPLLANIFLSHYEENWLNKCPIKFKPSFYRRYVDDIFVLFESSESADSFREYMSSKHQNINLAHFRF